MLQSIYSKMIQNQQVTPIGDHWAALGFQNGNPALVFNESKGVLHAIHMFIFFCLNFELFSYAFELSRDSQYAFPFATVSVVATELTVEGLLAGRLSKLLNSSARGVFENTCQVYMAAMMKFRATWQRRSGKKRQIEPIMKEVRACIERSPGKLVAELQASEHFHDVSVVE